MAERMDKSGPRVGKHHDWSEVRDRINHGAILSRSFMQRRQYKLIEKEVIKRVNDTPLIYVRSWIM
jgi:hypothetical protein